MNDRSQPENAFGLRWVQDDEQGRLIGGAGGDFRTPADAIRSLGLGCDEASLQASLDKFPPRVRIHGGYLSGAGDPVTRFTVTWDPGAPEASFSQSRDGSDEGMSGQVDVPPRRQPERRPQVAADSRRARRRGPGAGSGERPQNEGRGFLDRGPALRRFRGGLG